MLTYEILRAINIRVPGEPGNEASKYVYGESYAYPESERSVKAWVAVAVLR